MYQRYAASYFLTFLLLTSLFACANTSKDSPASAQKKPNVTLLIGQIYPSQHVILQPILNNSAKFNAWPEIINFYPLFSSTNNSDPKILQATFLDKISNTYIPMLENMPNTEPSECIQEGYRHNDNQYLLKDETLIQDYFSRGMPDNCTKEDDGARYKTDSNMTTSFPVIAISADDNLTVNYQNSGNPRPLSETEQSQVTQYIQHFKAEYKQAYGSEYDEKTDNIGEIPTLANAKILLEAKYKKAGYHIRVSTWERITVAYHIYRVIEVSLLKNSRIIQSSETSRYQGVLG